MSLGCLNCTNEKLPRTSLNAHLNVGQCLDVSFKGEKITLYN